MRRSAELTLSAPGSEQDEQWRGTQLLMDIQRVFRDREKSGGKDAQRISSTDLAIALAGFVDRPWATWSKGKAITPAAVARILKTFGIVPNTTKLSNGSQPNGYRLSQFADAFARYLPHSPSSPAGSSPSSPTPAIPGASGLSQRSPLGTGGEVAEPPHFPEKQRAGEVGELLEPRIETSEDDDEEKWPREPLKQLTPRARCLTGDPLLDAWF